MAHIVSTKHHGSVATAVKELLPHTDQLRFLKLKAYFVSEFDTVEFVRMLQQLGSECGGNELGILAQFVNHIWKNFEVTINILQIQNPKKLL